MKDDAPLIEATLAGDRSAFGVLVTKYQDRLYHTMVHVTGSAEDAEDVVQDAFVQAFVKLGSFRGASAFYTWLYRIAVNMAMSGKRRRRPVGSVDEIQQRTGTEPVDERSGPDGVVLERERVDQVRAAVAELRDDYRSVLVLRELEGQSYDTIAEVLDVPVGTVRSRLHRARVELSERLHDLLRGEVE